MKPFPHLSWAVILGWVLPSTPAEAHPRLAPLARVVELHNELGADGLHTFFFLDGFDGEPAKAPRIAPALGALGLMREQALFAEALALFPQPYAEDREARAPLFGYSTGEALTAFDRRLMAISDAFGPQEALGAAIGAVVAADPALEAALAAACAAAPEHVREELAFCELAAMTVGLGIDPDAPEAVLLRRLEALEAPRRHVATLIGFILQFENGGIHQFHFNAEGALAPDVPAALEAVGLPVQAGFMRESLAFFGEHYPRDTRARREAFFLDREWNDWDERLSDVTDRFYELPEGPGLRQALIGYARRHGLLAA